MKVRKGLIIGLLAFPALVLAAGEPIEKWTVRDYWQKLAPKISEQAVIELLGQPFETESTDTYHIWYYQQAPQRQAGKVIRRPRAGLVRFRMVESDSLLYDFKEPDWTITAPHTEAQYLAEQQAVAKQQQDEQARQERQQELEQRKALLEQQRAEAEQLAAQRREARLKAAAEARQQRDQQLALRQQELAERRPRQAGNPESKSWVLKLSSYKYWFTLAALFIAAAILISITYGFKK